MTWQTKKLGELVDEGIVQLTRGDVISKRDIAAYPGSYPIYSSAKENDGMFGRYGKFMFDEPLITWSVDGGGRLFYRPKHKFSVTNVGGVLRIKKLEILNYEYLFYVLSLKHSEIRFDWVRKAHPSVIRELYKGIPLPSLPEQKRIVKKLDEVFAAVGKAKENAEKNLKNSRELFESYLQNIFANPGKGWEEGKLGETYDVRDGTHDSPIYQKDGFALITSKNLKQDVLNYDKVQFISQKDYKKINERSLVNKGDVLFAMIGTIGNPVVVNVEPNFAIKNVALFKVPNNQDSYFLKYYLDSKFVIDKMMSEAKGTTQKFVGLGYLRNFQIMLPPLDEQKSIVKKLDALAGETKKLEAIFAAKSASLDELKKSVLKKAFAGEL